MELYKDIRQTNIEEMICALKICYFCSDFLDNTSKILKCLHGICAKCLEKNYKDSKEIQCKCQITTTGELTNYPVMRKPKCSQINCEYDAINKCNICNIYFCEECSEDHIHLDQRHYPNVFENLHNTTICMTCGDRNAEVYCYHCANIYCAFCQLNVHNGHKCITMGDYETKARFEISNAKKELETNEKRISQCIILNMNQKDIIDEQLKNSLKYMKLQMKELHDKLNMREKYFEKHMNIIYKSHHKTIDKNNEALLNLQTKNAFYKNVIVNILENEKICLVLPLMKIIMDKLEIVKNYIPPIVVERMQNSSPKIHFCLKTIMRRLMSHPKRIGDIMNKNVFNLSQRIGNENWLNLNTTAANSNSSNSSSVTINVCTNNNATVSLKCECCDDQIETVDQKLIKCHSCNKSYHEKCHIPTIYEETIIEESSLLNWMCTLCKSVDETGLSSNYQGDSEDTNVLTDQQRDTANRILLDIFSLNFDSLVFFNSLYRQNNTKYAQKHFWNPISLNDVYNRLKFGLYKNFDMFIQDINVLFLNTKLYYNNTNIREKHKKLIEMYEVLQIMHDDTFK